MNTMATYLWMYKSQIIKIIILQAENTVQQLYTKSDRMFYPQVTNNKDNYFASWKYCATAVHQKWQNVLVIDNNNIYSASWTHHATPKVTV